MGMAATGKAGLRVSRVPVVALGVWDAIRCAFRDGYAWSPENR